MCLLLVWNLYKIVYYLNELGIDYGKFNNIVGLPSDLNKIYHRFRDGK